MATPWQITGGGDALDFPYVRAAAGVHCDGVELAHNGVDPFTAEEIRDRGACLDAANALLGGAGAYTSEVTIVSDTEAAWSGCYGCLLVVASSTVRFCEYDAATNNAPALPAGLQKLCAVSVLPSPPPPSPPPPSPPPPSPPPPSPPPRRGFARRRLGRATWDARPAARGGGGRRPPKHSPSVVTSLSSAIA